MNIENININNNIINNKKIENNFEKGDILSGEIKSLKNNKYLIELDNNLFINIEKNKIKGDIGDTVYFEVIDDKNTLKQIFEPDENSVSLYSLDEPIKTEGKSRRKRSIDENNLENIKQYSLSSEKNNIQNINRNEQQYRLFLDKNSQPSSKENFLYSVNVKNKLSHLSNTLTKSDLQKFMNDGLNPKKLDFLTMSDYKILENLKAL